MTLARKIFFSMILNKTYTFEQIVYKMHNEWEREANKIAERDGVTNRNEVENHSDEEWFKAMCKPNARELILDALEKIVTTGYGDCSETKVCDAHDVRMKRGNGYHTYHYREHWERYFTRIKK